MIRLIFWGIIIYIIITTSIDVVKGITPFTIEYGDFILKHLSDKFLFILFISIMFILLNKYLKKKLYNYEIYKILNLLTKAIYISSTALFFSWVFYKIIKLENINYLQELSNAFYDKIKITNDSILVNSIIRELSVKIGFYSDLPNFFKNMIEALINLLVILIMILTFIFNFVLNSIYKNIMILFVFFSTKYFIKWFNYQYARWILKTTGEVKPNIQL